MTKLFLLTSLAGLLCGQAPSTRKVSDEFVGVWNLISFERRTAAGELTYPMGHHPVGRLTYDAQGRMSAQIMHPDRPKFQSGISSRGSAEEKIAAYDGYLAYYGTYVVKEKEHAVIHQVEGSFYPNWVGSDQRRLFEFSAGKLILRALNGSGGPGTESRLVWERAR